MILLLRLAGLLQLAVAVANLPAARVLRLDEEFGRLSRFPRQLVRTHHAYIGGLIAAFGFLSLGFAPALASGEPLGRALDLLLALFWGIRLVLQLFVYDRELRRKHRAVDLLFTTSFAFLTFTYGMALCR